MQCRRAWKTETRLHWKAGGQAGGRAGRRAAQEQRRQLASAPGAGERYPGRPAGGDTGRRGAGQGRRPEGQKGSKAGGHNWMVATPTQPNPDSQAWPGLAMAHTHAGSQTGERHFADTRQCRARQYRAVQRTAVQRLTRYLASASASAALTMRTCRAGQGRAERARQAQQAQQAVCSHSTRRCGGGTPPRPAPLHCTSRNPTPPQPTPTPHGHPSPHCTLSASLCS